MTTMSSYSVTPGRVGSGSVSKEKGLVTKPKYQTEVLTMHVSYVQMPTSP